MTPQPQELSPVSGRGWAAPMLSTPVQAETPFTCLNCESRTPPEPFLKKCIDYYLGTPFKTDYVKCSGCGLVQAFPIPENVSALYDNYPVHERKSKLHDWMRRFLMAPAYFDVRQLKRGATVLDYGCGDGWFLDSCKAANVSRVGFEPSARLAAGLSARLNVPVYSDKRKLTSEMKAQVDVLTMHFVVEHVTELAQTFRDVECLLKPEGRFFFTVPNIESWEARLFGKRWHGLDAPRHISFPTQTVVRQLAKKHGLNVVQAGRVPFPNGFAGSVPAVIAGHFNWTLYLAALPLGILLSRLAPAGTSAFLLQKSAAPTHRCRFGDDEMSAGDPLNNLD